MMTQLEEPKGMTNFGDNTSVSVSTTSQDVGTVSNYAATTGKSIYTADRGEPHQASKNGEPKHAPDTRDDFSAPVDAATLTLPRICPTGEKWLQYVNQICSIRLEP